MAITPAPPTQWGFRHSGEGRNPGKLKEYKNNWTLAFAGVTIVIFTSPEIYFNALRDNLNTLGYEVPNEKTH